jgi:hypothetical protein
MHDDMQVILYKKKIFFPINHAGNLCASSLCTVLLDHHPYTASAAHMSMMSLQIELAWNIPKLEKQQEKQKERISQKKRRFMC